MGIELPIPRNKRSGPRGAGTTIVWRTKGNVMSGVVAILTAIPWFAWIPIVGMVCGTIDAAFKQSIRHRERMAMIRFGIHPDMPTEKVTSYEHAEV
jgi:hypothetical protein